MLKFQEVDIVAAGLTVTYARSLAASFSDAFHFEYYGILIKPVADSESYLRLFRIFSANVWVSILISTFFTVLIVYVLNKVTPVREKQQGVGKNVATSFWFIFGVLLNQSYLINIVWKILTKTTTV